jgi:AcrR family transcriptional regulator
MRTKNPLTIPRIVSVAIAYVDANGMDALTLRALGDELGVHHTAMYRHFRNKDDLIDAMYDHVVAEAASQSSLAGKAPRAQIEEISRSFRRVLHTHPVLVQTIIHARGSSSSIAVERLVIEALRAMGCAEDRIAVHYQLIETFVFGSAAFDFAGAPTHLEMRRERHLSSGELPMIQVAKSNAHIDKLNEESFELGLGLILDSATVN